MPHGGRRKGAGRPPKPDEEKKTAAFIVTTTPTNKERFKQAGGAPWAEAILLKALEGEENPSPPSPQ